MRVEPFSDATRDECAAFWWDIYRDRPYVHRPDGYQNVNSVEHLGPSYYLKHLDEALGGESTEHWQGEVTADTLFLARDDQALCGLLVCSVDKDRAEGNILAAYMHRDESGRCAAKLLLDEALGFFQTIGLQRAGAAPLVSKTLEAECPIHLALLDAGFGCDNWDPPSDAAGEVRLKDDRPGYGVFLGGSLQGFTVSPQIRSQIQELAQKQIEVRRCAPDEYEHLVRLDTGVRVKKIVGHCTFAAFRGDRVVGWLGEIDTYRDWAEAGTPRIMGGCVPQVIPEYRNRGIGKVLYHLGIEEAVRQGAQFGWTATGASNPARLIYQSIGYEYWYLCFNLMYRNL